jgi:hypothetical protein
MQRIITILLLCLTPASIGSYAWADSDGKHVAEMNLGSAYKMMTKDPDPQQKDYLWVKQLQDMTIKCTNAWVVHGPDAVEIEYFKDHTGTDIHAATATGRAGQCLFEVVGVFVLRGGRDKAGGIGAPWDAVFDSGGGAYLKTQVNTPDKADNFVLFHDSSAGSVTVWLAGITPDTQNGPSYQVTLEDTTGGGQLKMSSQTSVTFPLGKTGAIWKEKGTFKARGTVAGKTTMKASSGSMEDTDDALVAALDLTQLGFGSTNGGYVTMKKKGDDSYTNDTYATEGDRDIANPVWVDADWDNTPETDDPVCFTINKKPKLVNLQLKVDPAVGAGNSATVNVKALATPAGAAGSLAKVTFGPEKATIAGTGTSSTIASLNGEDTVGSTVNNFTYNIKVSVSGDLVNWVEIQALTQKVFVLLNQPLPDYADSINGDNPISVSTTFARTAKRIDWATEVCKGKTSANIETGAVAYIREHPGFAYIHYPNPFANLDSGSKSDCISLANLAATALRLNGVDARPSRAFSQYKVVSTDNQTWGWVIKLHPKTAGWHLGYEGNNYEGYFYIGEFREWDRFPSKAYFVAPVPIVNYSVTTDNVKNLPKYLPILVLKKAASSTLRWRRYGDEFDKPDVAWKPGDTPIAGVTLDEYGATWTSDDTKDGDYTMEAQIDEWNEFPPTLKLDTGDAVEIESDGPYTLTCTHGSIKINVTLTGLPEADTSANVRIVPARTQADVP